MSTTTPGSEPERRDEASEPTAPAETGEVHPAGAPEAAERIERVEQADVPPPEVEEPDDDTVAFIGTEEAVAEARAEEQDAAEAEAAARLDDAINRANADAAASEAPVAPTETAADEVPPPVPADSVRRETYVPAATVVAGTAAGAATLAPEPEPVAVAPASTPQAIYVQAPVPPKRLGNRGFGVLVGLIATAAFALLYAGAAFLLLTNGGNGVQVFTEFLVRPVFWVPIVAFFVAFALLALILNTSAWWTWAVFGLLIGVVVYFSYTGGALITVQAWQLTLADAQVFIAQRWLDPFAIVAAVIARELPIWFGGWIAAHGRTVNERNRVAVEEYDRMIAAGPRLQPQP
ncbi:hypothetical protein EDM22_17505 [Agromyces tardus]|jgi:hypothetical protein|uniref:Uncharacterized protein n=1 Tax=Agromyces tardus TaxID=2583849 RepID=A0A3M8A231_9MICO|nr:hypothetical protein [Agromyces tardus]RNB44595.1 hypothetical protein EDM22_17505 [Agromyces tardus]